MTRQPHQPIPGMTAILGQLCVPRVLFLPTPCQVRYERQLELLLFRITIYVMVLPKLPPGGHVAKEPLGKTVTRNYGKEKKQHGISQENREFAVSFLEGPLLWVFFFLAPACLRCLLLDSALLKDGDPPS